MDDAERHILIDARTAGRLLDMLPARVKRLAKRGEMPSIILPDGEVRFSEDDLRDWVTNYRQPANGVEGGGDG